MSGNDISRTYVPLMVDSSLYSTGGVRFTPPPDGPECIEDDCLRPPYDEDGRCKRHHDLLLYQHENEARRARAGG